MTQGNASQTPGLSITGDIGKRGGLTIAPHDEGALEPINAVISGFVYLSQCNGASGSLIVMDHATALALANAIRAELEPAP